jgi:hypothetical protein
MPRSGGPVTGLSWYMAAHHTGHPMTVVSTSARSTRVTSFFHRRAWHEASGEKRHSASLGMRANSGHDRRPNPFPKRSGKRQISCPTKQCDVDYREHRSSSALWPLQQHQSFAQRVFAHRDDRQPCRGQHIDEVASQVAILFRFIAGGKGFW